jgi:hypothetical protein
VCPVVGVGEVGRLVVQGEAGAVRLLRQGFQGVPVSPGREHRCAGVREPHGDGSADPA